MSKSLARAAKRDYPHGTRARYSFGRCRCDACRTANRDYERARQAKALEAVSGVAAPVGARCPGFGRPCPFGAVLTPRSRGGTCYRCRKAQRFILVDSSEARAHVLHLSELGIGYRSVAAAASMGESVVGDIARGRYPRISAENAKKLLEVDAGAIADGALVDQRPTARAIERMVRLGITKTEIAQRLGHRSRHLLIGTTYVTARTEMRVMRLLREVEAEMARERTMPTICPDCGFSHAPADRRAAIARMMPAPFADVSEAFPCWYPPGSKGERRFYTDRAALLAAAETRTAA